jgi:hypothetical protein
MLATVALENPRWGSRGPDKLDLALVLRRAAEAAGVGEEPAIACATSLTPCHHRDKHGNLSHMRTRYPVLPAMLLCIPPAALGCDRNGDGDAGDSSGDDANSGDPGPACEVASMIELADADVVAPNGRTGSEILAAIPESFQTTLHWDLSNSDVEVEVREASGQSSTLNLTFTLPPVPKFYFEDRAPTSDEGVAVICDDYVKTTLDVKAETADGALSLNLAAVEVKLGTDDPSTGYWAKPFVLATRPLMSPVVEFVTPVAQPADSEKHVAISFDDPGVTGAITVYATSSSKTYRIVVARW